MRQTISVSSITILTLAGTVALSLPALGLPRYSVETVEFDRRCFSYSNTMNEHGQVLFLSGEHDWVWTTGGSVRRIVPPDPTMRATAIALDGTVYVRRIHGEVNGLTRVFSDGSFAQLMPAQTALSHPQTINPSVNTLGHDGRVLHHVPAIHDYQVIQVIWPSDSVIPSVRLLAVPEESVGYKELSVSRNDHGAGEMRAEGLPFRPVVRDQDTIRLLDRGGYSGGVAGKISADGRWIAGTLLRETLTGYDSVAVRWDREVLAFLSPLPGYATAFSNSINSDGITVGRSEQGTWPLDLAPTIWDEQGIPHNLMDLLETDKVVYPETPISIDEQGRILARGYEQIDGLWYDKAFFLTPIPEPAMIGVIVMLGAGLRRVR